MEGEDELDKWIDLDFEDIFYYWAISTKVRPMICCAHSIGIRDSSSHRKLPVNRIGGNSRQLIDTDGLMVRSGGGGWKGFGK